MIRYDPTKAAKDEMVEALNRAARQNNVNMKAKISQEFDEGQPANKRTKND